MDEIRDAIAEVALTKSEYKENNVADLRYQYASGRRPLPEAINRFGPWMIRGRGKARYAFVKLAKLVAISEVPLDKQQRA